MAIDVTSIVIEKGIPLPPPMKSPIKAGLATLLRSMAVGDSILVPGVDKTNRVRGISNMHRLRKIGYRFATRVVEGGVRVWRIE